MPAGAIFKAEILRQWFNNEPVENVGDAAGLPASAVAGHLYIGLHTADPSGGNQTTSEATYAGYSRVAVPRGSIGWTVVGGTASPTSDITLPAPTSESQTVTHVSVGTAASGTGMVLLALALPAPRLMEAGSTIKIKTTSQFTLT